MDIFARKMLIGAGAFGLAMVLMAGTLTAIYYHYRPPCGEAMVSDVTSPDGRWKAVAMERRCGDESPFYIHVNLIPAGEPIPVAFLTGRSVEGEVFLVEEEPSDMNSTLDWRSPSRRSNPTLEWTSPGSLTIHCPRCRAELVSKRKERWGPVQVQYELRR
ncbi:MAG TPA: hypothetical protein VKL40_03265 [Candidatus Angelobacter sp.]|nr:hypothetical protein [Candidatus Angelobacter sp.]